MIFPDLPKRPQFYAEAPSSISFLEAPHTEIPPAPLPDPDSPHHKTIEEWWVEHGLSPANVPGTSHSGPVDWLARDAWEFYFLCAFLVAWVMYWYQYSH